MSAAAEMAVILSVFFLIGTAVGVITVIAISACRPTRRPRAYRARPPGLRGHITAWPVQATMSRPALTTRECQSVPCPFRAARRTRS